MAELRTDTLTDRVAGTLLDALYPGCCPICGKPAPVVSGTRQEVCDECFGGLRFVGDVYCLKCGKELSDANEQYCYDCRKVKHSFNQNAAALVYTDGIKQSIYRYKYKGRREYGDWYGKMLAGGCRDRIVMWAPEVIIPVPLHNKKLKVRGYNQAEIMAKALGQRLNIPVDTQCLVRCRNTAPMKKFTGEERVNNLKNAFNIQSNSVKYNKILLVDDIYTTGTTLDACARVLKANGAKEVYCVSLCVGEGI